MFFFFFGGGAFLRVTDVIVVLHNYVSGFGSKGGGHNLCYIITDFVQSFFYDCYLCILHCIELLHCVILMKKIVF